MQIKVSPHHRQCKHPSCTSILSIYNHEDYCHVHLSPVSQEQRLRDADADKYATVKKRKTG